MAQRVTVILEDDIDGGPATEQIAFSFDGSDYEIDLSEENAKALREAMAPWVGHGRKVTRRRGASNAKQAAAGGATPTEIRAWAAENGIEVSGRGRIPAEVREAFQRSRK